MKQQLSVIIITHNEQDNIARCLASVAFADEIIVVDAHSNDDTLVICQRDEKVKTFQHPWQGYAQQKQYALNQASGDWVLSLDADEALSPELQQEIQACIQSPQAAGAYLIPMQLVFQDKHLRHTLGREHHLRLFKRQLGRFNDDPVHETIEVDGPINELQAPIWHYSFKNIETLITKMNHYSSLSANMKKQQGKRSSIWRALGGSVWMFFRMYVVNRGFLDGKEGLIIAVSFAEGSFYRYVKLLYD